MDRLKSLLSQLTFCAGVACMLGGCQGASNWWKSDVQPNVVFVLIDDLGWRDLGFMGSTYYETPNIDALAEQGMVFRHAYANAPNCAPTRAALLSGQYAPRHGVYTVGTPERGQSKYRQLVPTPNNTRLDTTIVTFPEALQEAGYTTGHFGKWHLGNGPYAPENQGFDVSVPAWWAQKRSHFAPDSLRNPTLSPGATAGQYMADYLTDRALDFVETHQEGPFFLYLAHHGVHTPIEGKADKVIRYSEKTGQGGHNNPTYAAMMESVDESIGRVVEKLDRLGIREQTVFIFFSDNGGYGPATDMHPLRGAKGMLFEGGIRVPMVVSWPGTITQGRVSSEPVLSIDFYPTILELTGASLRHPQVLDGVSLAGLFQRPSSLQRDALFWHFPAYLEAYRDQNTPWRTTPAGAVRMGDYKLIEFFGEQRIELYDLVKDPGETNNLALEMPEKARQLHDRLKSWRVETGAPVPDTPNPEFDPIAYAKAQQAE